MDVEVESADTPEEFLVALGERLKGTENADIGLADILRGHILKASPAQNAVALAKTDIVKLAGERADTPKPDVVNG